MNEGLSRHELMEILKESRLLLNDELDRIDHADADVDASTLVKSLVERAHLTAFQGDAILNRRRERLRIGNYDVLDKLGTGGTGTVFKARHRRMKRIVALKVLSRNLGKDKVFVQRFQREVETIAQLSHPNIVMAFDADEAKIGHFLVMEYIDGQDLASVVQTCGPMGLADAVDCVLQAARGLKYVHAQGMIHRDMKPANLLRDQNGTVKITDLGLARLSSVSSGRPLAKNTLTQAGGVLGTVDYMPPEQALDSTNLDFRSDIYSLGATLFFLLVGQPMYPGQTMMDTLLKHRDAPIPSLMAHRPDVPAALDDLFHQMVAKTVFDRVQTMSEVVRDLDLIQETLTGATVVPPPATVMTPSSPSSEYESPAPHREVSDHTLDLPALGESPNADLSVLLVEPSRTQTSIMRKYLTSQNIQQVSVADSGMEAIENIDLEMPTVVVSALYLPDMTGVELAQRIRAQHADSPPAFVLVSSEMENPEAVSLTRCGHAFILAKPFTPDQLMDALSVVTGKVLTTVPTSPESLGVSVVRPMNLGPLPARRKPDTDELRILLVDDSRTSRMHLRSVLTSVGLAQISEASDGAHAVALVTREPFDLVVTDYHMPLMDGKGLAGHLKRNPSTASIPIILVTAESDPDKLRAIQGVDVTAVCDKQSLGHVVREILERLHADGIE